MRVEQLEARVLSIVDQVAGGHRVEDSRVELKAQWPDAQSAARRIAGHANAAGGETILWIIGLDEKSGVVPVEPADVAEWQSKLRAQFDGVAPGCTELVVPTSNGSVTALLFETGRRPYVVKNHVHGQQGGGPVSLEVPWRDGTAIRSARREDLLRILVPLQTLPDVEVLFASVRFKRSQAGSPMDHPLPIQRAEHLDWHIAVTLYVTPRTPELVVLPVHKTRLSFALGNEPFLSVLRVRFHAPHAYGGGKHYRDSQTVTATGSEALLSGAGKLEAEGSYFEKPRIVLGDPLTLELSFVPAGQDRPVDLRLALTAKEPWSQSDGRWQWEGDPPV